MEIPSLSLLKSICYSEKITFQTKATKYGLDHEEIALKEYKDIIGPKHLNLIVKKTGFLISTKLPILGASPDGIVQCDCCGMGSIEVKCPYRLKDGMLMNEFVKLKNCFLYEDSKGNFNLKKKHDYYFQIQLQMFVSETKYCDFIVWSKRYLSVERIFINEQFLDENLAKAVLYHSKIVVPELLSKWYTSSNCRMEVELWCDCRKEEDGRQMILCANEECEIKWFHLDCMKLLNIPSLFWFCKKCSAQFFGNILNKTPRPSVCPSTSSKLMSMCVEEKVDTETAVPHLKEQKILSGSLDCFQASDSSQTRSSEHYCDKNNMDVDTDEELADFVLCSCCDNFCHSTSIFICPGCKSRWYCSRDCRAIDWIDHKKNCSLEAK